MPRYTIKHTDNEHNWASSDSLDEIRRWLDAHQEGTVATVTDDSPKVGEPSIFSGVSGKEGWVPS